MEIYDALLNRRSIRAYYDKPVEKEKLDMILKAGAYAPSALNNQKRQFIAITDKNVLATLNKAVEEAVDESTVARIKARSDKGEFNFFYNAPVLIVTACDEKEIRPAEDCACSLENMFLCAYGLGLGSCWINQLSSICDREPIASVLKGLGMKDGYRVYGCAAIGYGVEGQLLRPKTNEIIII
jgi:nitroreductase